MAEFVFGGPGNDWVYAHGKVAHIGDVVQLTKEQEAQAAAAGVTLLTGSTDLRALRATPAPGEKGGNAVNPGDGKPQFEASPSDAATPRTTGKRADASTT